MDKQIISTELPKSFESQWCIAAIDNLIALIETGCIYPDHVATQEKLTELRISQALLADEINPDIQKIAAIKTEQLKLAIEKTKIRWDWLKKESTNLAANDDTYEKVA